MPLFLEPRQLRIIITRLLPTSSDFDAFVIDYFPESYKNFTDGLDRTAKINLLFLKENKVSIESALMKACPDFMDLIASNNYNNKIKIGVTSAIVLTIIALLIFLLYQIFSSLDGMSIQLSKLSSNRQSVSRELSLPNKSSLMSDGQHNEIAILKSIIEQTTFLAKQFNSINMRQLESAHNFSDFNLNEFKTSFMQTVSLLAILPNNEETKKLSQEAMSTLDLIYDKFGPSNGLCSNIRAYDSESFTVAPPPAELHPERIEHGPLKLPQMPEMKQLPQALWACNQLQNLLSDDQAKMLKIVVTKYEITPSANRLDKAECCRMLILNKAKVRMQ